MGTEIHRTIKEGAPFTFARAPGLGQENIKHGTQIYIDGVAVFDRVLENKVIEALAFLSKRNE